MSSATPTESEILIRDFLRENPELSSEKLGKVEKMTGRYTNQEWKAQIEETQRKVKGDAGKKYESPKAGKELAETIDHTVLKLDVKPSQIDSLCAEARTEGFKVSNIFSWIFGLKEGDFNVMGIYQDFCNFRFVISQPLSLLSP